MSKMPNRQGKRSAVTSKSPIASASKVRKPAPIVKALHPRNAHNNGYDFDALVLSTPELSAYVGPNPYGNTSIDFANPMAVKQLNAALLKHHYGIDAWDIPQGYLCPPIPGRVDYLHYCADLLSLDLSRTHNTEIRALDIGTGANGVYPLLGIQVYGWQFVASDIDLVSLENVGRIARLNPALSSGLQLRHQQDPKAIFKGIIRGDEYFDITICNPPFHGSLAEASAGTQRKLANLSANRNRSRLDNRSNKIQRPAPDKAIALNFGGQKAELWCEGGELGFLANMINESQVFAGQCLWFTSLVSKSENLKPCYALLEKAQAIKVKTIEMQQGNKITRILAWTFLTSAQQRQWQQRRG